MNLFRFSELYSLPNGKPAAGAMIYITKPREPNAMIRDLVQCFFGPIPNCPMSNPRVLDDAGWSGVLYVPEPVVSVEVVGAHMISESTNVGSTIYEGTIILAQLGPHFETDCPYCDGDGWGWAELDQKGPVQFIDEECPHCENGKIKVAGVS